MSLSDDFHVQGHPRAATLGKQVMSRTCAVRYSAMSPAEAYTNLLIRAEKFVFFVR